MYMKDWNEVVEYVENFTQDLLQIFDFEPDDYDVLYELVSKDVSYYTIMVMKNFSSKS